MSSTYGSGAQFGSSFSPNMAPPLPGVEQEEDVRGAGGGDVWLRGGGVPALTALGPCWGRESEWEGGNWWLVLVGCDVS